MANDWYTYQIVPGGWWKITRKEDLPPSWNKAYGPLDKGAAYKILHRENHCLENGGYPAGLLVMHVDKKAVFRNIQYVRRLIEKNQKAGLFVRVIPTEKYSDDSCSGWRYAILLCTEHRFADENCDFMHEVKQKMFEKKYGFSYW